MRLFLALLILLIGTAGNLASGAVPSLPSSFSVCWWNIENFGVADRVIDDHYVNAAMKPPAEIKAVASILAKLHPDILGVAEIVQDPHDKNIHLLHDLLKEKGLDLPFISTVRGEDSRIQVVLFSRFPIEAEEPFTNDTFPVTLDSPSTGERRQANFRMGRGIVNTRLQIAPGMPLEVMLVHLKSKRAEPGVLGEKGGRGDEVVRRNEASILRKHIDEFTAAHPGADLLVMGDFNDTPGSHALRPFFESKNNLPPVKDLPLTDYLGDWWTEYFEPPKCYDRIDYIFATPALYQRFIAKESFLYRPYPGDSPELDTYAASDHRPLFAKFLIKDEKFGQPGR